MLTTHSSAPTIGPIRPIDEAVADYALVRKAIAFLTERFRQQPELDDLAAHLGLKPDHCRRFFKRWCGLSPKQFVQALTLDHARAMLAGSASLLDTALEVGLSGPSRLHDLFVVHEAMTPGQWKRRGEGLEIAYGFHPCPFGIAVLMATERGICGIAFADGEGDRSKALADLQARWPGARFTEAPKRTAPLAASVFAASNRRRFEPTRLVMIGSDFEVRVWRSLLKIPIGQACSYADIAQAIGKPGAARAVGAAVGRNPLSFVVPCHRVLGKSGTLTGYHWGVTRKQAIIGWEKGKVAS